MAFLLQESRRAERAEQQRVRAEKERDRQTRIAVKFIILLHFFKSMHVNNILMEMVSSGGETEEGGRRGQEEGG